MRCHLLSMTLGLKQRDSLPVLYDCGLTKSQGWRFRRAHRCYVDKKGEALPADDEVRLATGAVAK